MPVWCGGEPPGQTPPPQPAWRPPPPARLAAGGPPSAAAEPQPAQPPPPAVAYTAPPGSGCAWFPAPASCCRTPSPSAARGTCAYDLRRDLRCDLRYTCANGSTGRSWHTHKQPYTEEGFDLVRSCLKLRATRRRCSRASCADSGNMACQGERVVAKHAYYNVSRVCLLTDGKLQHHARLQLSRDG